MPSSAATVITVPSAKGVAKRLFDSSPRHKNRALELKIGEREKQVLHELIDYYGMPWLSDQVGLHSSTIYRLLAGYGASCKAGTTKRLKEFLVGYYR